MSATKERDNDVMTTTSTAGTSTLGALDPAHPVVVLGNGPVGQTAALLLASWNVPVVLLDSRPERDPIGSKALCQQRDVLDIWGKVGAGQQIADEGVTWEQSRTLYKENDLFVQGFVNRGMSPYPPFVNVGQNRTEDILDEKIAAQPLIDVRWGHEAIAVRQDDESVTLTCKRPDASTVEVSGAYCIAAAGARGDSVRETLGLTFDGKTFEDYFLICDIKTDMPGWALERRFYFDPPWNPGRQVLIHPCPNSTFRIDWQVPPNYDLDAEEASGTLDKRIRTVIGERDYEIVWKSVYRFHARQVDRMRVGRVLIAGDLAHLVAPFGARGLNSGVPDAENAAWKIAYVMHGWADDSLLDSYHWERDAAAKENLDVTGTTMRFLVPQNSREWTERREILEAAVKDPSDVSRVNSGRMAEAYWYVDSPLTTRSLERIFPGRPPRGADPEPVPGVIVPDAPVTLSDRPEVTRLREIVRDGVTVLLGADADVQEVREALLDIHSPLQVLQLADIDTSGALSKALDAGATDMFVIRPDAHIAAVVHSPTEVARATRRLTCNV
ncbi:MAG TPA: FAD-dependent monooxygenase [Dermatophilaceae bacterium]|nr:FAD-dependent monooxygenase [Dermatophilaceae bacterium]